MLYTVVINGIVYRGTLEELQQLLVDERENLGQYTLALWLSQRTISHTFLFTSKFLTKMEAFPLIHLWVSKYTKFLIVGQELRSVIMDRTNCTLTFELTPCQTLTQILDEMTWAEPDDNIITGVIECQKVGHNWRFVINTKIIQCRLY